MWSEGKLLLSLWAYLLTYVMCEFIRKRNIVEVLNDLEQPIERQRTDEPKSVYLHPDKEITYTAQAPDLN